MFHDGHDLYLSAVNNMACVYLYDCLFEAEL